MYLAESRAAADLEQERDEVRKKRDRGADDQRRESMCTKIIMKIMIKKVILKMWIINL